MATTTMKKSHRPATPGGNHVGMAIDAAQQGAANHTVKFGSVTVTLPKPTDAEVARNVELSTQALERLTKKLLHPGVKLPRRKDLPLFFADDDEPGKFIRLLNGKRERGVLENGEFKVT